MKRSKNQANT